MQNYQKTFKHTNLFFNDCVNKEKQPNVFILNCIFWKISFSRRKLIPVLFQKNVSGFSEFVAMNGLNEE